MKQFTVSLEDEALYTAVETEAARTGQSIQEIMVEALEQWLADTRQDEEEHEEIEAARREWREKGGIKAGEFFRR
jgi:hypothetical protein